MITRKELGKRIKKYRDDLGLSQDDVALKIGIPRPAISQIESGHREISSFELAKIANIFQISADDLLSPDLEDKEFKSRAKKRNMPKFNKEKFKQVLLYMLEKCGARANVGETALYKLLYFADFNFYELYEEPLTGAMYRKISYGPAPCDFKKTVEEMIKGGQIKKVSAEYYGKPQNKYLPLVNADIDKWNWSAREKDVIDKVIADLSIMDARTISEYSHQDIPWEVTKDKELISYDTVFYRKQPYSVRSYPEE